MINNSEKLYKEYQRLGGMFLQLKLIQSKQITDISFEMYPKDDDLIQVSFIFSHDRFFVKDFYDVLYNHINHHKGCYDFILKLYENTPANSDQCVIHCDPKRLGFRVRDLIGLNILIIKDRHNNYIHIINNK